MELKEGAIIAGRFRLERLLGKGGMGDVWAAQHIALDIPCAVKFIHSEAADKPEVRERFEREAKAAAALRSPNVVQILDYGIAEGNVPYLAMEYLEGEALSTRIRRLGRLDPAQTCRIIAGIGRALTKAHAAGIVHRDLKPENVYIVPDEDGEIAKVLDFGVAKVTTQLDSNTRTGALLGTPYYMSPEQAQGVKAVDSRADLWSLAVVAFRCITGELPFKSDALGDLLIRIVTQPPPVPSHVCPGLPDSFDRWWARASQREPEHRYPTAKELCDALALSLGMSMPTGAGAGSVSGIVPIPAQQQTVAFPEMTTPFPGGMPYGAAPMSAQAAQSEGYTPYPVPMHTPQPFGDSQASASVVGMATATSAPAAGGKRTAVVVAGVALTLAAVAGAVVFLKGGSEQPVPAASSSAVAAEVQPSATASTSTSPTANAVDATAAPVASATAAPSETATASAKAAAPPPPPQAPVVPVHRPSTGSGGSRKPASLGGPGF